MINHYKTKMLRAVATQKTDAGHLRDDLSTLALLRLGRCFEQNTKSIVVEISILKSIG